MEENKIELKKEHLKPEFTKEKKEEQDRLTTLKDIYNYIHKHYWFIGNCRTQKATLEYYQRVLLKIKEDLDLVFEDTEKDFQTGLIK